jgi:hypothetical protein
MQAGKENHGYSEFDLALGRRVKEFKALAKDSKRKRCPQQIGVLG